MNDPVDRLIDEVAQRHRVDQPYYVTAATVFYEAIDNLDSPTMDALLETGRRFIRDSMDEGIETLLSVTGVTVLPDPESTDTEDETQLTFYGFLAVVLEELMRREAESDNGEPG